MFTATGGQPSQVPWIPGRAVWLAITTFMAVGKIDCPAIVALNLSCTLWMIFLYEWMRLILRFNLITAFVPQEIPVCNSR